MHQIETVLGHSRKVSKKGSSRPMRKGPPDIKIDNFESLWLDSDDLSFEKGIKHFQSNFNLNIKQKDKSKCINNNSMLVDDTVCERNIVLKIDNNIQQDSGHSDQQSKVQLDDRISKDKIMIRIFIFNHLYLYLAHKLICSN